MNRYFRAQRMLVVTAVLLGFGFLQPAQLYSASASAAYNLESEVLDGGGRRSASAGYSIEASVSSPGGLVTSASLLSARNGFAGRLNNTPAAVADSFSTSRNIQLSVPAPGVLGNDSDFDRDFLSAVAATPPSSGSLTLHPDGSFVFDPAPEFTGTVTFSYRVTDGISQSQPATVTIRVNVVNRAPAAVADIYSTSEDTQLVVAGAGVLVNDTDPDGDALAAVLVTPPAKGQLSLDAAGSFRYTPNANYSGPDAFSYRVSDGQLQSAAVQVSLQVLPVNDAPVGAGDGYTLLEDSTLNVASPGVLGNDQDPDGDPLGALLVSGPLHGQLILNSDGSFSYTPAADYFGPDSFVYRATDGRLQSGPQTVNLTVTAVNDPPVARPDQYVTGKDVVLNVGSPGVLGNDSDAESETMISLPVSQPAHGALTLNANGTFIYIPAPGYVGTDSFTYKVSDGLAESAAVLVTLSVGTANHAPVGAADAYSMDEDTVLSVAAPGVLGNDSDIDLDLLTSVLVSGPSKGSLVLDPAGSFKYVPSPNFNGTDSFSYRANDGQAASSPITVNITVRPVNDAPVANAQALVSAEDSVLPVVLTGSDPEGSSLLFTVTKSPGHGTLSGTPPNLSYQPHLNFNGSDSFEFKVTDGLLDSTPAQVTISVTPVNDSPVALGDKYSVSRDTALVVAAPGVLGNDTDVEGSVLSAVLISPVSHGTLALSPTGSFNYTPTAGFVGNDSFVYKVTDGIAESSGVTVTISVNSVNRPPVALADSYTLLEDQVLNIAAPGVLANDLDADGDSLVAVLTTGPARGALLLNPDGSFRYTPGNDYNGADSFAYKVGDGQAFSAPVTVSLLVQPVNDPPVAIAQNLITPEETPLRVLLTGNDIEGSPLAFFVVANPLHGTLVGTPPDFSYLPAPDFNGADEFLFKVSDGQLESSVVKVSITVTPVNDPPVARADQYSMPRNTQLSIAAPGVLGNDTDAENSPLETRLVSGPSHGTLSLHPDGSFVYNPDIGFAGLDQFEYQAIDGLAASGPVTVRLSVNVANRPPVATPDNYTALEDSTISIAAPGLLGNDSDPDGDSLIAELVSGPAHGSLVLKGSGDFVYTPTAQFSGTDSFVYRVFDGQLFSANTTVVVSVSAVNDPPLGVSQIVTTQEDSPVSIALSGSDPENGPLAFAVVSPPLHGTLAGIAPNLSYSPDLNFSGQDAFKFIVNDGTLNSTEATVLINIIPVNDVPVAAGDSYNAIPGGSLVIVKPGVLGNDADADGDLLKARLVAGPLHGVLALNDDGSFTYTPASGYNGPDTFIYKATDSASESPAVTVEIQVGSINRPPLGGVDSYAGVEDVVLNIAAPGILGNDSDPDGDHLTAVLVTLVSHGTLILEPNGAFHYTPAANFNGQDSFVYKPFDGLVAGPATSVFLNVVAFNDPPVAGANSYATPRNKTLTVRSPGILIDDSDAEGSPLTAVIVAGAAHGQVVLNPDGSFTYVPSSNFVGADSFSYRAGDGTAFSDETVVTIFVVPLNNPPSATADAYSTQEDVVLSVGLPGVLANDSDPHGDVLKAVLVDPPQHGRLLLDPGGSFLYSPDPDFQGDDQFTYFANDGFASSDKVTVALRVVGVNDAPRAVGLELGTIEDTPVDVVLSASDPEKSPLVFSVIVPPKNGALSGKAPNLTYTPNLNVSGLDSFSFRANDGNLDSAIATVTIQVLAQNDPPVADSRSYESSSGVPLPIVLQGSDPEGDPLTYLIAVPPRHGQLIGKAPLLSYVSDPGFRGEDRFTFVVRDPLGATAEGAVSIKVKGGNLKPLATDAAVEVLEDSSLRITLGGVDPDGDSMSFRVLSPPRHGQLSGIAPDLVYTPAPDFNGTDRFNFVVSDGLLDSSPGTIEITVLPVNDPPVVEGRELISEQDEPVDFQFRGSDPDKDELHFFIFTQPQHGSVQGTAEHPKYVPNPGFVGEDGFGYMAFDGQATSGIARFKFTILPKKELRKFSEFKPSPTGPVELKFQGISGRRYTLQFSERLDEPVWVDGPEVIANDHGDVVLVDGAPPVFKSRFYRVIER